jgi:hypothetical protein
MKGLGIGVISSSSSDIADTPLYNGWMGIAPYQGLDLALQDFSFMKQLSDHHIITDHVVAINARDNADPGNSGETDTVVKFGGWDKNATLDGTLKIYKTVETADKKT